MKSNMASKMAAQIEKILKFFNYDFNWIMMPVEFFSGSMRPALWVFILKMNTMRPALWVFILKMNTLLDIKIQEASYGWTFCLWSHCERYLRR